MPAYIIAFHNVLDPATFAKYGPLARPTIERYGAKALVAGENHIVLEGQPQYKRLVILEFDSMESAQKWYQLLERQTMGKTGQRTVGRSH